MSAVQKQHYDAAHASIVASLGKLRRTTADEWSFAATVAAVPYELTSALGLRVDSTALRDQPSAVVRRPAVKDLSSRYDVFDNDEFPRVPSKPPRPADGLMCNRTGRHGCTCAACRVAASRTPLMRTPGCSVRRAEE